MYNYKLGFLRVVGKIFGLGRGLGKVLLRDGCVRFEIEEWARLGSL